jgi:hypothetical protein
MGSRMQETLANVFCIVTRKVSGDKFRSRKLRGLKRSYDITYHDIYFFSNKIGKKVIR